MLTLEIVKFISIECKLQMSGELSVGNMAEAWVYAQERDGKDPTVDDVLTLGRLCEPYVNALGFRTCGVQIGFDVKMNWQLVPEQIVNLMENQWSLTIEEFFREYEEIHPFRDSNGRTGVILFNWLGGTLDIPLWAPNFWNDSRRTVGYGA